MPRKQQFRQLPVEDKSMHFDEVIAGVFCSKRHTGQFNDRFETGELEFNQVFNTVHTASAVSRDSWTDCVVHDFDGNDFDTRDDIMVWPADFDETSGQF